MQTYGRNRTFLHHEKLLDNMGNCTTLKRQAQAMACNYEMHKKAFKTIDKKYISFKPQNSFQKKV